MEFNKYQPKKPVERRKKRKEGPEQQVIKPREPIVTTISIKRRGLGKLRGLLVYKKLMVTLMLVFALVVTACLVFVVFPAPPEPEPTPSIQALLPQPPEVDSSGLTDMPIDLQEVLLREIRVGTPGINSKNNEIIFAGGMDNVGNPKLTKVYMLNTETRIDRVISQIIPENSDVMNLVINDRYIVWADSTREGNCILKYQERESGTVRVIKECPLSVPKLRLGGSLLAFSERTGDKQDKLYVYDLTSGESVTLAVFEDSPYGISPPDIDGERVAWSDADTSGDQVNNSIIKIAENGSVSTYSPQMYAFGPLIHGRALCWIDQNRGPDASLFLSVDRQAPVLIEEGGVDGYAIGDNFIAYCKEDKVYAYFYERGQRVLLSKEQKRVQLAVAEGGMVAWFDVSREDINRDLLYYTRIK